MSGLPATSVGGVVSRWHLLLPHLPFSAALAVTTGATATGRGMTDVEIAVQLVVGLVLAHQLLILTRNTTLLEQLRHEALHDPLTGLANRPLFQARVREAVGPVAVLVLDLDGFKTVNDVRGHAAGDQLLTECGQRLRSRLRSADTVARLGGDEFAVLLPAFHRSGRCRSPPSCSPP